MLFFKLSAFYFFYFAAVGVYVIFIPKVLSDIGYSTSDIGIVLALAPLMRFLTPFLFLKYIQLNSKVFKITLISAVISSSFFYITIDNFYAFMINNAILGICLSIVLPYIEIIALNNLGKNKYGKSRLFGSVGFMMIGLVLANFLSNPYIALNYYLSTIILTTIFSFLLIKYDVEHNLLENDEKFSLYKYWTFWLSLFLMQISFGSFYNFFTIYEISHGISLKFTSYLWAFGVICEIIMLYFQAPLLKNNLLFIIKLSTLITTFRWLLLFLFPNNLYISYFSQSIHAISFALYHSTIIVYLYSLYTNKKLAQQFMFGIAYGLGGFIGALIAGYTYGEYLFLGSAFISFISFIVLSLPQKNLIK
jgi:PPP family 3-phenylpropionic acid transporter